MTQYKRTRELAYIEMELMEGGSLGAFIRRKKSLNEPVTEMTAKRLLRQVLAGVCYLHQKRIIHRDIKPENILVDDTAHPTVAKITDFGISAKLNLMVEDGLKLQCGTHIFKSPEQLNKEVYSKVASSHAGSRHLGPGHRGLHAALPGQAPLRLRSLHDRPRLGAADPRERAGLPRAEHQQVAGRDTDSAATSFRSC